MRKLIVSINSTANDIVTGPPSGDETDIGVWSQSYLKDKDSLNTFLISLAGVDTILLGRATYGILAQWSKVKEWPDVDEVTLRIGEKINTTPKIVVTNEHPLESLAWGEFEPPTQLSGANIEEQVKEMKEGEGGDIITFGSPTLVQSLINAELVDEFQLIIYPVIMNEGRHLFENLKGRMDLRLVGVTSVKSGVMLVTYEPRPAP